VYLANYLFLDRAMTPAEVGALGGSNAAGILFPELPPPACAWQIQGCPADYDNSGGIDGDDVIAFFGEWDAGAECADADESGGIDGDDVIVFFGLWDAGGC
jgi:hypothetical protein